MGVIGDTSPWLMERRRLLMQKKSTYQQIEVVNRFTNASAAKTEVATLMSQKGYSREQKAIVLCYASEIKNNQLLWKDWYNQEGDTGGFFRLRNGSANLTTWGSSTYDCVASPGDKYFVVDPTNAVKPYYHQVTAERNYTNAPQVKTFVSDNAPADGVCIAFRVGYNPSEAVLYDFICAIVYNGVFKHGARFGEDKKDNNGITDWNNTSYSCKIYAGDVINYVKVETAPTI